MVSASARISAIAALADETASALGVTPSSGVAAGVGPGSGSHAGANSGCSGTASSSSCSRRASDGLPIGASEYDVAGSGSGEEGRSVSGVSGGSSSDHKMSFRGVRARVCMSCSSFSCNDSLCCNDAFFGVSGREASPPSPSMLRAAVSAASHSASILALRTRSLLRSSSRTLSQGGLRNAPRFGLEGAGGHGGDKDREGNAGAVAACSNGAFPRREEGVTESSDKEDVAASSSCSSSAAISVLALRRRNVSVNLRMSEALSMPCLHG
mmetsp:Transcript_41100/g.106292  ORF Transcript_41100/g.106292 Transcript_41100/m.106292 type:complete len:268 (+) Transcript_41100:357-1160(+)